MLEPYDVIVVDIPIGLLSQGTRFADAAARAMLKKRSCCVFTAPIRPLLGHDYPSASKIRRQIDGKGLSKQSWAIMPKIAEVDMLMTPENQSRIKEGHPEVSFAEMNRGEPLFISKRSERGRRSRLNLLARDFPRASDLVRERRRHAEDVIDALAMLWTAKRICRGKALKLPAKAQRDSRELLAQIWA